MKSPRPPRMAGRCAAILLIRLVAPALGARPCLKPAVRCACSVGRPSVSTLSCCSSSHVIPNHTFPCLRGAFARTAGVFLVSTARMRRSSCLLLRRLAAPPVFSFSCARPARGGRSAERRTWIPIALARRDDRVSETRCRPGRRDDACRRSTVAVYGPRDHASRVR
jgi:hypothetical protein